MKNRSPKLNFALVVGFALCSLALPVWAGTNTLEIKCVDQAGAPLKGVSLQIQQLEKAKITEKKSDNQGSVVLPKLDDGSYRVLGRKEGFDPALYEFAVLKDGAQQTVTLKFEPGDPAKKVYLEDPAINQKSFDLFKQGLDALQAGNVAEAEKQFHASLDLNPSNQTAQFYLGQAYARDGKLDQAEEALKKASMLSSVYMSLPAPKGAAAPPTDVYGEVKKAADTLLSKLPSWRLRAEGDKAAADKRYDEAVAKYNEALKADPGDPDIYYNLAVALANSKKFDEAGAAIDQAVKAKPGDKAFMDLRDKVATMKQNATLGQAQALRNEGNDLLKANDGAGALKKYEAALALIPADKKAEQAMVLQDVAKAHSVLKHTDETIAALRRSMDLAPDKPEYRKTLGDYYLSEKKYDEALDLFSDAKAAGSQPVDQSLFSLGQKLAKTGNNDVAELAFDRTIKANPQNAEAYYELGMILYYAKKDDKRALELLTKYAEMGKDKAHVENTQTVLVVLKKRMK